MTVQRITRSTPVSVAVMAMAARIVERFHPMQVILFGSQARGDARPDSDVDLLVVLPDGCDPEQARRDIVDMLSDCRARHDVIVTTPDEIRRRGNLVGPALRPALRDGVVLYDADLGMIPWHPGAARRGPAAPVGEVVSEEERLAETRRWLRQGHEDLRMAELVADGENAAPSAACYHAQQAAEKALEALLVFLQIPFPKTHKLDELRDLLPNDWEVKAEHPGLQTLSEWVFKGRYPGDWPEPSLADAGNASRQARSIWDSVLRDLEQRGFELEAAR